MAWKIGEVDVTTQKNACRRRSRGMDRHGGRRLAGEWRRVDLNHRPRAYESPALATELRRRCDRTTLRWTTQAEL
jgi:hypothetical protein